MSAVPPGFLASVRKRPGMYIGDTDDGSGLHHMLWELVANCVDEHLAGHCRRVEIVIHPDESVSVEDDGRGIRVDDDRGKPYLERVLTEAHVTGTRDGHTPHAHCGPFGVGLAVVNALSEWLEVETGREGATWTQRYRRGIAEAPLARAGAAERTGVRIKFRSDAEIFGSIELSYERIHDRLAELAALSNGLRFELRDERRRSAVLHSSEGLADLPELLRSGRHHPRPEIIRVRGVERATTVDVALTWQEYRGVVASFVNMQRTTGGSHEQGLRGGFLDAVRVLAEPDHIAPRKLRERVQAGLRAVVHVVLRDAKFGDPTKQRLDEPAVAVDVRRLVARVAEDKLRGSPLLEQILRSLRR